MRTFNGTIRQLQRGGWSARGIVLTIKHGQMFETQVGPEQFSTKGACARWLRQAASRSDVSDVRIVTVPRQSSILDLGIRPIGAEGRIVQP